MRVSHISLLLFAILSCIGGWTVYAQVTDPSAPQFKEDSESRSSNQSGERHTADVGNISKRLASLSEKLASTQQRAAEIAGRVSTNDSQSKRQELRRLVSEAFETRQELQLAELQELREQMSRIEDSIAARERMKDKIIEHRVAELLDPTLQWEVDRNVIANNLNETRSSDRKPSSEPRSAITSAYLESMLQPLWPLQQQQNQLSNEITQLELLVEEASQAPEIPSSATPKAKQLLEEEHNRRRQKIRALRERITELQTEADSVDRQIDVLMKKLQIEGVVQAVEEDDIIQVSIGTNQGAYTGLQLLIHDGQTSFGLAEIIRAQGDRSIARIVEKSTTAPIRVGQRATISIDKLLSEIAGRDPGEPIYNDRLKRFKFELEKMVVSDAFEIAAAFCHHYEGHGHPPLSAVWGDPRTNSLVIVGPPEADQAIRSTLAKWEGAAYTGIELNGDNTLEGQQKELEWQRRSKLRSVTSHKLRIIDLEADGDEARLQQAVSDLKSAEEELASIEKKLMVINESLSRQNSPVEFSR